MKTISVCLTALSLMVAFPAAARAGGMICVAHGVIAEDPQVVQASIQTLRAAGQQGLDALFAAHANIITKGPAHPHWPRVRAAIEAVSKQRDGHLSRLFWHTDFDAAKAEARASGKPILSLRLLGNLDDEFSCANSRFFRTALYPNAEVSQYLRTHFVLHWKSVRPVPRVTIDFGDGRTLERTITGNSIHYVLDTEGRPIDALPGLYGPKAFLRGLARAEEAAKKITTKSGEERTKFLREFHATRIRALDATWSGDFAKLKLAEVAPQTTTDATWTKIAALHVEDAQLDEGSRKLMLAKMPSAKEAAPLTMTKAKIEDPLLRAIRMFERSIAEDTVRNEYMLHAQIHHWFINDEARTVEALNDRVYAELFLTPRADPWLGLVSADSFTALEGGGLTLK